MLPSPAELQYFLEVSGTLNISRAAERLGVTQPTLSLGIQRLEANLGLPLLIRNKSGVKLTRIGQKFAIQARQLLSEWEKLKDGAIKDHTEIRGRYTLGCHTSVALYSLPSFLPALLKDNPGLEIKLVHDLSRRVTESVISYQIDFAIAVNPVAHPDLVIQELCKDEVTLWVNPKRETADTLICDPDLAQTQTLLKAMGKSGLSFGRTLHSSSLELIASLVAVGGGVGVLPTRVALRENQSKLQRLGEKSPVFRDRICLVYRADAQKSKAGRTIAEAVRRAFSEQH